MRLFTFAQMPKKKNKSDSIKPPGIPRELEIEDLEQPDESEDREELRKLFAEEIEEREKENEFYKYEWRIEN